MYAVHRNFEVCTTQKLFYSFPQWTPRQWFVQNKPKVTVTRSLTRRRSIRTMENLLQHPETRQASFSLLSEEVFQQLVFLSGGM